ncbi:MAG: ohrR [Gammaproteobacteria bacterium]|jgi:DNA-binding MarR family transcriptional regulator|nr:ohrR [Gammaproteobacteria bacterium]
MTNSAFGFERPEDSPGFLLWQTTITWQRLIKKALGAYDISHAQFVILALLLWFTENKQEPSQIVIANLSKLDKMTVSKSLKNLAAMDLIMRSENQKDTRAKSVYLTEKGKSLAMKLIPVVEKIDEQFFGAVNKTDQQALIKVLNKLNID